MNLLIVLNVNVGKCHLFVVSTSTMNYGLISMHLIILLSIVECVTILFINKDNFIAKYHKEYFS